MKELWACKKHRELRRKAHERMAQLHQSQCEAANRMMEAFDKRMKDSGVKYTKIGDCLIINVRDIVGTAFSRVS